MKILKKTPTQLIIKYAPSVDWAIWMMGAAGIGSFLFHKPADGIFFLVFGFLFAGVPHFTVWDFNKELNELIVTRRGAFFYSSQSKFVLAEIEDIRFGLWSDGDGNHLNNVVVVLSNGEEVSMLYNNIGVTDIPKEKCQNLIAEISDFLNLKGA